MSNKDQCSYFMKSDHSLKSDSSLSPQLGSALESISTNPYPQEPNHSLDTLRD